MPLLWGGAMTKPKEPYRICSVDTPQWELEGTMEKCDGETVHVEAHQYALEVSREEESK